MTAYLPRAHRAALALATGIALALPAMAPASAEESRVFTVQASADLQKRAEMLLSGVKENGGKVTWGSLEAGAGPESVVIKQLQITSPDNKTVTIEEINVRAMDWANAKEPRHADIGFRKLAVAASAMEKEQADGLKELEIDNLVINGEFAFKFDEADKSFDLAKVTLDLEQLGELRLRLKLTGITPADLKAATGDSDKPAQPGQNPAMGLLSRLNLAGAAIAFKDKGLLARVFKADAKKKNVSEAAAKAKFIDELNEERGKAEDDVTKEVIDAVIKFVRNPNEIEFVMAPSAPANVMMAVMTVMGNRATFKQLLGLTIAVK